MSAPAVTLIVLTYNQARYVDDALASVVAQTTDDFEVVLVDNASTDGSAERLKQWLPKLTVPAKLVVNPRNYGVSGGDTEKRDPVAVSGFNGKAGDDFNVYYSLDAPPDVAPCHETRPEVQGWVCK